MKLILIFTIFILQFNQIITKEEKGCPFGFDKLFQKQYDQIEEENKDNYNLQQVTRRPKDKTCQRHKQQILQQQLDVNSCSNPSEVLIKGVCKTNDISDLSASTIINDNFILQWGFPEDDDTIIQFKQTLDLRSWMGLGFGKVMAGTDMIITQIQGNQVTIFEGISLGGHQPPKPAQDQEDTELLGYEFTDDSVTVKFSRKLQPKEIGYKHLEKNQLYEFIAAHSPANEPSDIIHYHDQSYFQFNVILSDDFKPDDVICKDNEVLINNECQQNNISELSSKYEISENFTLQWEIDEKENKAYFLMQNNFIGWVGFGFGKVMLDSDMFIAEIKSHNVVSIYESIGPEHSRPKPNLKQNDIELLGYSLDNDQIIVKFRRTMTPDIEDLLQLKEGEKYDMIAAHSDPKNPQYLIANHGKFKYQFEILFSNDQPQSQDCPEGQVLIDGECKDNDISDLKSSFTEINQGFNLQWSINKDTITFISELNLRSWFGIGFSTDQAMKGADMLIFQIKDNDVVEMYESIATGHKKPEPYSLQTDNQLLGYQVTDNSILVKYSRQMTPDLQKFVDFAQLKEGDQQNMIAAHSPPDNTSDLIESHGSDQHYAFTILLENNQQPELQCPDGEVIIDEVCKNNDIEVLSSQEIIVEDEFELQWQIDSKNNYIEFLVNLNAKSWIGIGFSDKMDKADMIIMEIVKDNQVTIYEGIASGHNPPVENPDQSNIQLLGYQVTDTSILVKFRRQLEPTIDGYAQLKQGNIQNMIAAHSPLSDLSDTIKYHDTEHYNFVILLENNQNMDSPLCTKDNQVYINGKCQDNYLSLPNSYTVIDDGKFLLYWQVNDNNVDFLAEVNLKTWLGIGFGESMLDSQMVISQIFNHQIVDVQYSKSTKHSKPVPYKDQSNITLLGYQINNDSVKVKYSLLKDSKLEDHLILKDGETYQMIAAHSEYDDPQNLITSHDSQHFAFQILLENDITPPEQDCPDGEVIIDDVCTPNDISDLSSNYIISPEMEIQWTVPSDPKGNALFLIKLNFQTWSGIGFGKQMKNTDMIISQIYPQEKQKLTIYEGVATGHNVPKPNDDQSDLKLLGYQVSKDKGVIYKYSRQMTPDIENYAQLKEGETIDMISAYSELDSPKDLPALHHGQKYQFQIPFVNDYTPAKPICPDGEVYIDEKCVTNDIEDLSSEFIINMNPDFILQWNVPQDGKANYAEFLVKIAFQTWTGIGFDTDSMINADMVIAQVYPDQDQQLTIFETISKEHTKPQPIDNQSNIKLIGYQIDETSIIYKYQKYLTPDTKDDQFAQLEYGKKYQMIAASSPKNDPKLELNSHGSANYNFEIQLSNDYVPDVPQCKEGEVLIDNKCVTNNLSDLSSQMDIGNNMQLQWQVPDEKNQSNDDTQYALFMIKLNIKSWVGIGSGDSMTNSDMIIGEIFPDEDQKIRIYEGISQGHSKPQPNPDQSDIQLLGYEVTDNSVQFKFQREMTPKIKDYVQLKVGETYKMIAAHSNPKFPKDQIAFHDSSYFKFDLIFENGIQPFPELCPKGEVYIDKECVKNDLCDLSSYTIIAQNFQLQWEVPKDQDEDDDTEQYVTFKVKLNLKSWSGIGFGKQMKGSDMIISQIFPCDDQPLQIYEGVATGHSAPEPNPDQSDIKLLGYQISDNEVQYKFKRKMNPGIKDYINLEVGKEYSMIAAHSSETNPKLEITYHSGAYFSFDIELSNNIIPSFPTCQEGEVIINGKCEDNDISNLSSYLMIDPGFRLQWEISEDQKYVDFIVQLSFQSWIGIGFGSVMDKTDMIISQIYQNPNENSDDYIVNIFEGTSQGHNPPVPNNDQSDLQLLGYKVTSDLTLVKYRRLMTPDIADTIQLKEGETYNWIAAHSDPDDPINTMQYHDVYHYNFEITLSNNQVPIDLTCEVDEVIIDNQCVKNDIKDLSSKGIIQEDVGFDIQWEISEDEKYITFLQELNQLSYVSIGFGTEMKGTDMIICNLYQNTNGLQNTHINRRMLKNSQQDFIVKIYEGTATGYSQPPPNKDQSDLKLLGYIVTDSSVKVKYQRKMEPSSKDGGITLTPKSVQNMISAYSEKPNTTGALTASYHNNNKFNYKIVLENGQDSLDITGLTATFMFWHKNFFLLAWGVLIDIAIVFVRNFKIWNIYLALHGIILLVVDVGTVIIFSLTLIYNSENLSTIPSGWKGCHYLNGLIVFTFLVFNHAGGVILKYKFVEPVNGNRDKYAKLRQGHQLFGNILYFMLKWQLFTGLMSSNGQWLKALFFFLYSLIFRGTFEYLHRKKPQWYINLFFKTKDQPQSSDTQQIITMLREGASRKEIIKVQPDFKYVIADNKICKINSLLHPGGNYLLKNINGRDIDCYLFGGYNYELSKRPANNHSVLAYTWLNNNAIGDLYIDSHNYILNKNQEISGTRNKNHVGNVQQSQSYDSQAETNIQIKDQQSQLSQSLLINDINLTYEANIINSKPMGELTDRFDFKLTQNDQVMITKNYLYGVEWMGKHLTLKLKTQEKKRNYTTVLCMKEDNINLRKKLLQIQENNFEENIIDLDYSNTSDTLPLIIKNYEKPTTLSSKIHGQFKHAVYELTGPHGLGLQLKSQSKGQYIISAAGTGILPFLDIIDFMFKKSLFKAAQQTKGLKYAQDNFDQQNIGLQECLEDFKLKIYISYNSQKDFLAKDMIVPLYQINKKYNLKLVDIYLRFSDKSKVSGMQCIDKRFDDEFFNREFLHMNNVQRAWVCGPPMMQVQMIELLGNYMDRNDIDLI